ncbi:MAG: ATP-dependent zinc metalloprotease FtsH [Planctomycetaceae bacterium]|nr:MAG: ATP-dependent zinc metalloprotease FtsH [Planctomycetaceae bacterium]
MVAAMVHLYFQTQPTSQIRFSFLESQIEAGNVLSVRIGDNEVTGYFEDPPPEPDKAEVVTADPSTPRKQLQKRFRANLARGDAPRENLMRLLREHDVEYEFESSNDNLMMTVWLIAIFLPMGLLIYIWISYRRSRDQMMGGGFLTGFSKSPAKRYEPSEQTITFRDVAGLEGVKADLQEVVEYLQNPEKFQRLGGRVPKGVLLNGAPGTGKTLLARAVAGEAEVPYYSVSASEFIQMFVGVGASRVRDLFKNAKDTAPAIIFIDEIDAVGRQRGAGLGGGHDEREQTLNQILSEMDGFAQNDSVIVLAATNRPDVLDPALLRPGRFDRHVTVNRPTQKGRVEIFKVHVRQVPLTVDVDLKRLAAATVGLTGADIRNIVNEAALWAARHDKKTVDMSDFDYARDRVLMGAKREEVLLGQEKEKTAYHEAGHTIAAWFMPGADPVHKVTIIPRGRSLGTTQMMPSEDRLSISENQLRDLLVVALAGRAAELLVYQEATVGAENDLERASGIARRMVMNWGMSSRLGPVSYKLAEEDPFLGRELHQHRQFSEHTMEQIDQEVFKILHDASERASSLLLERRQDLDRLAQALLAEEECNDKEIEAILGPSVHARAKITSDEHVA